MGTCGVRIIRVKQQKVDMMRFFMLDCSVFSQDALMISQDFRFQIWGVPKIVVPQNGWFIMENPIKMDDLGGNPPFKETPI